MTECGVCNKPRPDDVVFKNMAWNAPEPEPTLASAAWEGNYVTVEKLLIAGADVNEPNAQGKTPYQLAEMRGDKLTMGLLERYGADRGV